MPDEIQLNNGSIIRSADAVKIGSTRNQNTWTILEGPVSEDGFFRISEMPLPNWSRRPQLIIRKEL